MRFKRFCSRRAFLLFLAIGILTGVAVLLDEMEDTVDIKKGAEADPPPLVTVVNVSAGRHSPVVEAFGEVEPRWAADLKSEVDGVVINVHPGALAGSRVREGDPLVMIDDTRYLAELAEAERAYQEAELEQEQAVYATRVAQRQFDRAGEKPPNDLALHLPQLHIANALVKAARARVKVAKRQLDQTVIRAPYSGHIVERFISPGQLLMAGDPIARLISDRHYDIAVRMSKRDWQRLSHPIQGQTVSLYNGQGTAVGEAVVRESGGYLDEETRHYIVHLGIPHAEIQILAGDFVRVFFQGRAEEGTLSVPASALTADGSIWWVEREGTLARAVVEVLFHTGDRVLVRAPTDQNPWRVVVTPLSSYLPGQRVRATTNEAR